MRKINFRKFSLVLFFIVIFSISYSNKNYSFFKNYSELKNYDEKVLRYGDYEKKSGILYDRKTQERFTGRTYDLYSNGKLEGTAEYINGEKNGIQYEYYPNGKLSLIVTFEKNQRNGIKKLWRENGTLHLIAGYKDNKLTSYLEYYEDGKTILGTYEINGDRVKVKVYDKKGRLEGLGDGKIINHETIAVVEDGIVKGFYPNGTLKSEAEMRDGKGSGLLKTYYENGKLQMETTAENSKIKGELTFYYPNGNKQLRIDYLESTSNEDGIINGNVETYNQNGSIQYRGYFDNVKVSKLLKEEYGDIKNNKEFLKLLKRFM